ncbi:type IV secretory system conjugative DNA transfer family protein [Bosea thiooxidans]
MANPPGRVSLADDTGTLVLLIVLGFSAMAFLTPVGLLAALAPALLYRLSYRPNWVVCSLVLAAGLLIAAVMNGTLGEAASGSAQMLWKAVTGRSEPLALLIEWVGKIQSPSAWFTLGAVGLAIGSARTLIVHERELSALNSLMQGTVPDRIMRAPLAPWFHRRVEARPARRGSGIVIGSEWRTGAAVSVSDSDLGKHTLVVGTTGAGKTTGLLNLIEGSAGMGIVIVDGKGDIDVARRVIAAAKSRGQKTYLFDATGQDKSAIYNPLADGDFTSLADRIITMREWTEPHYRTLAEGFAQTAFKVLQSYGMRVDLLSAATNLDTKYLINLLRRVGNSGNKYKNLLAEITAQRDAEEHIEGLRADLRNLANSVFAPLFDTQGSRPKKTPVIELVRARTEGALVYFCLPALRYPAQAAKLGRLIVNDIKYAASTSQRPWRIVLDEFSVFAGPQVLNIINMGRSNGLSAILATQSLADIAVGAEKDGRSFTDQVIGSINTFIAYRLNSAADCELIASVAGTEEQVEFTAQTVNGSGTGAASARHTRSFKVHPDTIRDLDVGDAIYVNKNSKSAARSKPSIVRMRRPGSDASRR